MLLAATGLMAVIAIPSLMKVARLFKRSKQWQEEDGHDRAERREYEWYWSRKKTENFPAPSHLARQTPGVVSGISDTHNLGGSAAPGSRVTGMVP
jgi:hypothetical protein